ncbi:hypothetical protein [Parahaliea aestuarii]|nr:hypothetical protein [Parahaliea aestuarii]
MRQLSVVDGVQVFHVTANTGTGSETDLDKAIALAKDLVGS